jgi:hypothetical protein
MPNEVTTVAPNDCPADGPYGASTRYNTGFCDYATRYMIGKPGPSWYTNLAGQARTDTFNYASLVGPFGARTTDNPNPPAWGWDPTSPAYALLGANFSQAQSTQYHGGINIEQLSR